MHTQEKVNPPPTWSEYVNSPNILNKWWRWWGGGVPIYYLDILILNCFNILEILTDIIPQVINHPVTLTPAEEERCCSKAFTIILTKQSLFLYFREPFKNHPLRSSYDQEMPGAFI